MRSKRWKEFETCRERIVDNRLTVCLMRGPKWHKPYCSFRDGRLLTGTQSKSKLRYARLYRTVLRIKRRLNK